MGDHRHGPLRQTYPQWRVKTLERQLEQADFRLGICAVLLVFSVIAACSFGELAIKNDRARDACEKLNATTETK